MRENHDTIHQDFLIITGVIFAIFVVIVVILSSSILFFCLRFHWPLYDMMREWRCNSPDSCLLVVERAAAPMTSEVESGC